MVLLRRQNSAKFGLLCKKNCRISKFKIRLRVRMTRDGQGFTTVICVSLLMKEI